MARSSAGTVIRPALLVALALGFLTAFAAGLLGMIVVAPDYSESGTAIPAHHTDLVVKAFYSDINAWIAGKDHALEHMLGPDFVDHTTSESPDRNATEFLSYLSTIRTFEPTLRFNVLSIEGSDAIVSVDLERVGVHLPSIEGWRIELPEQPPLREILRIEDSLIQERWGPDDLWPGIAMAAQRSVPIGPELYQEPSIQRFELNPGAPINLIAKGTVMLWVESGELGIDLSGTDQKGATKFSAEPLAAGDMRFVRPTGELRVRAVGEARVALWTVSVGRIFARSYKISGPESELETGIRAEAIIRRAVDFQADTAQLSVLIVTLPVGATLSTGAADMNAAAVVAGELQADPKTGEVFYFFGTVGSRILRSAVTALSSEGFASRGGSAASYQVVGSAPATLVLLSVDTESSADSHPVRTRSG
ncbi:MAG: hypothetical protein R2848_05400 [Thermomicrobiales bacterium]